MDSEQALRFTSLVSPPALAPDAPAWWFLVRGGEILIDETASGPHPIPVRTDLAEVREQALRVNFLGLLGERAVYAVELPEDAEPPPGLTPLGLRELYGAIDDRLWALAGRAAQIVEWDRTHQFCGRCGTAMDYAEGERAKRCPACGMSSFPRLSPAVITLVERDDGQVLLARGPQFAPGLYALVAGFVEPGESLEEAVAREIKEEVGVDVDAIRYFGSQPWPFPNSIMIGFTARYAGGAISIDGSEIEDARWFRPEALPKVPQRLSIARKLIDNHAARHGILIDQP